MSEYFTYPKARKDENAVDVFHNISIKDPYAWMTNRDSLERQTFIDQQNKLATELLNDDEIRMKVKKKFGSLWHYTKCGCPVQYGNKIFITKEYNRNQKGLLYCFTAGDNEGIMDMKEIFDPNSLSEDGSQKVCALSIAKNGQYFAYGVLEAAAWHMAIHVRNVDISDDVDIVVENAFVMDIQWTKDSKGFFYSRLESVASEDSKKAELVECKLYYHLLGKELKEDVLVCAFPKESNWHVKPMTSHCGQFLFILIIHNWNNMFYYLNIEEGNIAEEQDLYPIINEFEGKVFDYITNEGAILYVFTNYKAPNFCIMTIDINDPAKEKWSTLVPEHEVDILDKVVCADKNKLVLVYERNVMSVMMVYALETGEKLYELEVGNGKVVSLSSDRNRSELFYSFTTFHSPEKIFQYDLATPKKRASLFYKIDLNLQDYNPDEYILEQVYVESTDKALIPMFIVRKHEGRNTPRPCFMTGYGGCCVRMLPEFAALVVMFLHTFDGIFAMPSLRGGGEFGQKWYDSGRLQNKQNVFNDFQACAEYLIKNNLTTKDRLVIHGFDHGSLVVGTCINQRPDLFGAAVIQSGLFDILRLPETNVKIREFGNILEQDHFENIYKYSPLENVHTPKSAEEEYPAILLFATDIIASTVNDTLKFGATLQEALSKCEHQKKPIIMRIYPDADASKMAERAIEGAEEIFIFLSKYLTFDTFKL